MARIAKHEQFLHVVGYYDEYDLRKIKSSGSALREIEAEHKMRSMDVVVYTNKKMTRFRLVLKINKFLVQCIPEISDEDQFSLYLKINETLSGLTDKDEIFVKLMKTSNTLKGKSNDIQYED